MFLLAQCVVKSFPTLEIQSWNPNHHQVFEQSHLKGENTEKLQFCRATSTQRFRQTLNVPPLNGVGSQWGKSIKNLNFDVRIFPISLKNSRLSITAPPPSVKLPIPLGLSTRGQTLLNRKITDYEFIVGRCFVEHLNDWPSHVVKLNCWTINYKLLIKRKRYIDVTRYEVTRYEVTRMKLSQ